MRVGRVTAISDDLLQDSLEYHLSNDKRCNDALAEAQRATQSAKKSKDRNAKAEATDAVKRADAEKIKAAHRIMEGFDAVVCTCIGAADKR